MRSRATVSVLGATLSVAAPASACPCQGSSGPAAGVTTSLETVGASVTETARVVEGGFLADGRRAALAPGTRQWSLDVTGIVGYRPLPTVEVSAEAAVGRQAFTSPDVTAERVAFGDTTLRARWDALDEPMPYEKPVLPWPALTAVLSLRMPTSPSGRASNVFTGQTGSVGASASSEGLGAFEPALGVVLARTIAERYQITAFGEGAYRFSDTYLGIERHLAPRFFAQLAARYSPTPSSGIGLVTDLGWEGDIAYRGVTQGDTNQRLWTVGAFGWFRAEPTNLRWGAMVRYAPPVDSASKNAAQATSIAVSLGYAL